VLTENILIIKDIYKSRNISSISFIDISVMRGDGEFFLPLFTRMTTTIPHVCILYMSGTQESLPFVDFSLKLAEIPS